MLVLPSAKPFIFVLMPFGPDFDDIYRYGIKKACEENNCYCERVDEQNFDGTILDRIYNQISRADVIISDMTGRNPNVFYETGYAHALNKRVILCTQNEDDIPFDLKHYTHLVYGGRIGDLADKLGPRIAWALTEGGHAIDDPNRSIRYSIQGIQVEEDVQTDIIEYFNEDTKSICRLLQIDILNDSNRVLKHDEFDIGILIDSYTGKYSARLQDGRYWHVITGIGDIFPGSLRSIKLELEIPHGVNHEKLTTEGVPVSLKEISKYGHRNINFVSRLRPREAVEFEQHFEPLVAGECSAEDDNESNE